MKIALFHYHLKTGGVTTVIQRQVQALQGRCDTLVLTGDRAGAQLPCPVVEIPEIGYDCPDSAVPLPEAVVDRIITSIRQVWPGGCDVLHIHNPTLTKNRYLLRYIHLLQAANLPLLLQIHDFAEDGRPQVYSREAYPRDCHYGVINARDMRILIAAGLDPAGVHLIPNAVEPLPMDSDRSLEPCVVYPVRAIRRKNIGEAILLSLYLRAEKHLHISQPPTSPGDVFFYRDWRSFVDRHGLKLRFETGRLNGFPALVAAADSMVTTSITEGFGFSFLEPWTAGKMLWGRRLDDICTDFEKHGLRLDALYDEILVPLNWFDFDGFQKAWHETAVRVSAMYAHPLEIERLNAYVEDTQKTGIIDYGNLSEIYQKQVLEHLLSDPKAKDRLASRNPRILEPDLAKADAAPIERNREIVRDHFDLGVYGQRLVNIYTQVNRQPVQHQIDKTVLLDAFLDMNRFSLLKWGPYAA